jgi:NAD(P)-dependent dehydrogenase (short-subunit alcohol dehydrogenase family)
MKSVEGRVVLVTGAAMGMGRLFAERAVGEGARSVVLWDIDEAALQQTVDDLAGGDCEIFGHALDVADLDSVRDAAEAVLDQVGAVEVLVNNAGVVRGNNYFWETDSVYDTTVTIGVNTLAPMYVTREFLPAMIEQATAGVECRLLNLASAAGFTPNPRMAAYAGSKWAVIGWSDSVRLELGQAGIDKVQVTTVCPFYVNTGMFEGAKSVPFIPILEPDNVVDESWKGMCAGQAFVILPRTVVLSEMLKGLVPVGIRDFIAGSVLGVYHSMDEFTGRPADKA